MGLRVASETVYVTQVVYKQLTGLFDKKEIKNKIFVLV